MSGVDTLASSWHLLVIGVLVITVVALIAHLVEVRATAEHHRQAAALARVLRDKATEQRNEAVNTLEAVNAELRRLTSELCPCIPDRPAVHGCPAHAPEDDQ